MSYIVNAGRSMLELLLLIVWWTMFSGRKKGELPGQHDTPPRDDERAARKDAAGD